jgi:hypothetical protein
MFYIGIALVIIAYRLYAAGKMDFTYGQGNRWHRPDQIDTDKVMTYTIKTIIASAFWIFVLPGYGLYKFGQRQKEKSADNK